MDARCRAAPLTFIVVLLWAASAATAQAAGMKVKHLERVSPTLDLPQSCLNEGQGPPSSDVEPHIAVNPTDKRNIIATWFIGQEDFRDRAQAGGVAYSKNGGRTWKASVIQGVDACSGGPPQYDDGMHDTWLSFAPDGYAYLIGFAYGGGITTFWSLTSEDGGRTWSAPVEIITSEERIDRPTLTADPTRPDTAYIVYSIVEAPYDAYLQTTTDGGATWSAPTVMYRAAEHLEAAAINEIVVLPDGTLVNVFLARNPTLLLPGPDVPSRIAAIRSTDGGRTWSAPVTVSSVPENPIVSQPDGEGAVFLGGAPGVGVAPNGTLFVAWHVDEGEGLQSRAYLATSIDAGASWSDPKRIGSSDSAFQPDLAIAQGGTVGVHYYDLSDDKPGDERWTAKLAFAHSHTNGDSWSTRRIGRRFDLLRAPQDPTDGGHSLLGHYTGIAAAGGGFASAFGASRPFTRQGLSDIWVARLVPQRRR